MAFEVGTGGGAGTVRKNAISKKLNESVAGSSVKNTSKTSAPASSTSSTASSSSSPYGKNYFGFGSKEAYARAIQQKEASGQKLSNPEAAERFKAENPDLFKPSLSSGTTAKSTSSGTSTNIVSRAPETLSSFRASDERNNPNSARPSTSTSTALGLGSGNAGNGAESNSQRTKAIQNRLMPGSSSSSSGLSPSSGTSTSPGISMQTIGTPPTDIDVTAGTQMASTTNANVPEAMSRTPFGFAEYVGPIGSVPTVDELYNLYKQVAGGQEDQAVRDYLASPDFQSVLGGTVPFWMQADPVWRLYLQRLGMLSPEKSSRMKAMMQRLGGR